MYVAERRPEEAFWYRQVHKWRCHVGNIGKMRTKEMCEQKRKRKFLGSALKLVEGLASGSICRCEPVENHRKIYFLWKKIDKHTFFFLFMKIKMMGLWMHIRVQNWYSSWILVCYISSNLPPECLKCTDLSQFSGGGGGGGVEDMPPDSPRNFWGFCFVLFCFVFNEQFQALDYSNLIYYQISVASNCLGGFFSPTKLVLGLNLCVK